MGELMRPNLPFRSVERAIAPALAKLGFGQVEEQRGEPDSARASSYRLGGTEQILTIENADEGDQVAIRFSVRSPFGDWVEQYLPRLGLPAVLKCRTPDELTSEIRILVETLRRGVLPHLDGMLGP
jgi:hypothetical protein